MSLILPQRILSRRQLLQWPRGAGLLLSGCGSSLLSDTVGRTFEPLNQSIEALLLTQKPVPEFPVSAIEADKLLINTFDFTPQIDPAQFRLTINGEVNQPLRLSMADIQELPLTSMVIRHVCVEGWAAIVQWSGVRLRDLVALVLAEIKCPLYLLQICRWLLRKLGYCIDVVSPNPHGIPEEWATFIR